MSVEKCTQDYFDREKQDWLDLREYLDCESETIEKLNYAKRILWWDINQYVEFEKDEDDWKEYVDVYRTDRDWIDQAIKDYFEPLSIKKYVSVDPRTNEIEDVNDCTYEIWLCVGWPWVFFHIDTTAELVVNWWWDHLTRDFGSDMAEAILSFYWLE